MDTNKTIGTRIKQYRETNGISQEELADIMEVKPSTIKNWEDGNLHTLRADKLAKLAITIGVSSDELIM